MDGLTNIIAKINGQNDAECASVIEKANEKAFEILEKAKALAEKEASFIAADTQSKVTVASSKASSGAELTYKRAVLSKKSELISKAIDNAVKSIAESPDEVYFGYIQKLILSNALCGEGKLVMSKKDKDRLPDGFIEKVNEKLGSGKSIVLSDKVIDEYGFVIEYDEMKADCTFPSLIEDALDEIRDSLGNVLFA